MPEVGDRIRHNSVAAEEGEIVEVVKREYLSSLYKVRWDDESLGGPGRIGLTFDVPVKVVVDGREVESTVQIRWTEDGPELPDPDGQALRIMKEIGGYDEIG